MTDSRPYRTGEAFRTALEERLARTKPFSAFASECGIRINIDAALKDLNDFYQGIQSAGDSRDS